MKKLTILSLILFGLSCWLSPVCAHQQVVVIPMGGGNSESNSSNSIIGSWWFGEADFINDNYGTVVITFMTDGYYVLVDSEDKNMELGRYSWNSSTGEFIATVIRETDGDHGLSELNSPTTFSVSLNGNTLTLNDGTETSVLFRIVP